MANKEITSSLQNKALTQYPLVIEKTISTDEGILLKTEKNQFYHLKRYSGAGEELKAALEAEDYLVEKGFSWSASHIALVNGEVSLKHNNQEYYLKKWQPEKLEMPNKWQLQLGCELLAEIHKLGEGFKTDSNDSWTWPDWIKIFEMARDTIYELHTAVIKEQRKKLTKYFDRTAPKAFKDIEKAIVQLKRAGYYEQREEAIKTGYISLSQVPTPSLGMNFDLIELLVPDLPACGLGAYLGQSCHWQQEKVLNKVVELLEVYDQKFRLFNEEIEVVKGFLEFPWEFWWVTEQHFLKSEKRDKKRNKKYAKALKKIYKYSNGEIMSALNEL